MSRHLATTTKYAAAALTLLLLAGCTSIKRHPVPIDDIDRAIIHGMPDIRDWGDEPSPHFQDDLIQSVREAWEADRFDPGSREMHALVLSGGGSNGAFGAGYLNGWTEAGNRPTFKLVTGISTGALIAPYAFLGAEYDAKLEEVFTTVTNKDIYEFRNPLTALNKDSLARTDPLALKLEEVIDDQMLQAIAAEHRSGRRLYVGTTNLDAQRLVVWNMGAIAASGQPGSIDLFRKVLLASASIPVAFPPVYIEVEVDGQRFDEMHVDGGVIAEFFLWGAMVDITDAVREFQGDPNQRPPASIYIIRNSQIDAEPAQVEPKLIDIASRSMITVLKAVAMGDLIRVWALATRDGVDFNYVGIPPEHAEADVSTFDPGDMRRLFELGRAIALSPEPWRKEPPTWVQ
jgi:predicted acylesterase/phospholipase RssA